MRLVDRVGERREPGDFARIDHKHQTRTSSRQRHQREGTSLGVEFSRGVVMGAAMHLGDTIRTSVLQMWVATIHRIHIGSAPDYAACTRYPSAAQQATTVRATSQSLRHF